MKTLEDTKTAVLGAITKLQDEPRAWVSLARLRDELGEAHNRHAVDEALMDLHLNGPLNIAPEPCAPLVTQADEDSAIRVGNQWCHLVAWDA